MRHRSIIVSSGGLTLVAVCAFVFLTFREPVGVQAVDPLDTLRLTGVVRDFRSDHPDFGISDTSALGHYAWIVQPVVPDDGRPVYIGGGSKVVDQWFDKDLNPIAPYATDPGLPGGHFDVDVFDELSTKQRYHKHEFDDAFDVTYVDLVNDPHLLYDDIVGSAYPYDLRVEFFNPHHASGSYTLQDGPDVFSGDARGGFATVYSPATLVQFRVDLVSLMDLRGTKPSSVQSNIATRDDAFSIRLYDTTTDELVYELAVYHHISGSSDDGGGTGGFQGNDSCGISINDTVGHFGNSGPGAVRDADSFRQWYRDVLGTNLSKLHVVTLHRDPDGVYEYLTPEFFPIEDQLLGNEGRPHNNHFTYAIDATFTYDACSGQFFEFEGNDDCWVFIDRKRVIDIGGTTTPDRQYIALDRLDLVDGAEYPFGFFFAHRRDTGDSVFRMRTNILLDTPDRLPVSAGYD